MSVARLRRWVDSLGRPTAEGVSAMFDALDEARSDAAARRERAEAIAEGAEAIAEVAAATRRELTADEEGL